MRFLSTTILLNVAITVTIFAADRPGAGVPAFDRAAFLRSAASNRVLRIGLVDCIAYVLQNNSEIRIQQIEPKRREEDIRIARSAFEPVFAAGATRVDGNRFAMPTSAVSGVLETKSVEMNAGVSGMFSPGTLYEVSVTGSRTEHDPLYPLLDPVYRATPRITLTQPLFRGAGREVNTAEIRIAQNNLAISRQGFRDMVMQQVSEALNAYHGFFLAIQEHAIRAASMARARDLLTINKERYGKGLISSVELLETEAAVARLEKDLIAAESQQKTAEDRLKLVTNLIDDPELWNAELELIDPPRIEARTADLVDSLERAFQNRPDYESRRLDLANRDIVVKLAKDARYPQVDLVGSLALNGVGEDFSEARERANSDYRESTIGLQVSVPWGGGDRARLDQRRLEKEQALIGLQRLEQAIILDVRDRVRAVDVQSRQMAAARLSLEKERENYDAQKVRYGAGQLSTHDMLDYEERLAMAEAEYTRAVADYQVAWVNLEKSEGTTLVRHDIILEE